MGKVATFLTIISVVLIGFHLYGLLGNTPISLFLEALLEPASLEQFSLVEIFTSILGGLGLVGILAGAAFANRIQWVVNVSFITALLVIGWDLISVFNVLRNTPMGDLALVIVSPLMFLYVFSVWELWNNKD